MRFDLSLIRHRSNSHRDALSRRRIAQGSRIPRDGDDRNIVFLPKLFGCLDDLLHRRHRQRPSTLKAQQFARRILRFDDAVRIKRQPAAAWQL